MKLSARSRQKLARLRKAVARLPVREQPLWRRRISAKVLAPPALVVQGDGEAQPDPEWDLMVANWLDNAYTIVSDRANEVRKGSIDAVKDAGFALWPLALVVGVFAIYTFSARRPAPREEY